VRARLTELVLVGKWRRDRATTRSRGSQNVK
jgi:hypothetical protein